MRVQIRVHVDRLALVWRHRVVSCGYRDLVIGDVRIVLGDQVGEGLLGDGEERLS